MPVNEALLGGVKIAKATRAAMGDAYPDGEVDEVLFWMADQMRLGRKSNAGFYAYDDKGKRLGLWDGLALFVYASQLLISPLCSCITTCQQNSPSHLFLPVNPQDHLLR